MERVFKKFGVLLTFTVTSLVVGVIVAFLLGRSSHSDAPGTGIGMILVIWFGGFVACVIGIVLVIYRSLAGKVKASTIRKRSAS